VTYGIEPVNGLPGSRRLFRRLNRRLDPDESDQDHLFLLTELVRGLDFKYYDERGRECHDWNSRQPRDGKRLPARMKITLLLADQYGHPHQFATMTDFVLSR
jgi:hypothetical protein